ncbi:MAG: GNAT family N-acetyltransferase [Roseiflexaceae bacterium]|nr:GNAT family N-acetyltransferase [Roseiflexaceae bacterium]
MDYTIEQPGHGQAQAFLEQRLDQNLPILGSLLFEPLELLQGVWHAGQLAALAVVAPGEPNIPGSLPTVMVEAQSAAALAALHAAGGYPPRAVWSVQQLEHRAQLEVLLGQQYDPVRGAVFFIAEGEPPQATPARQVLAGDATLDLSACDLSTIALSFWILRGWRMFGVIEDNRLLGHALAAYPIADTEEIAAVFTAAEARRRGIASACVAAAAADIRRRGKRAVYVARKTNHASIAVAEHLGMRRICETWEIEVRP